MIDESSVSLKHEDKINDEEHSEKPIKKQKCIRKDIPNIIFLMFLYLLQGVPSGFLLSMQFVLSGKNTSYSDQGFFSLSAWPFTLKLLWAPMVDAIYVDRIGRRKSWLVPVQYLIGILLVCTAPYVNSVLGENSTANVHAEIYYLTALFTVFIFLAATQDIAVDAWAITMLSKDNMEWASICNNAGAVMGILLGNSVFLIMNSAQFCNTYFRSPFGLIDQDYGIMNVQVFMIVFGIIFIVSTTIILFFINERNDEGYYENLDEGGSIGSTFKSMILLLKLKPMQKFISFLLTWMLAFAMMKITALKMIEIGIKKETLGIITIPFQIFQIVTPIFIGKFFTLKRPLNFFFIIYPIRMLATALLAAWIYSAPYFQGSIGEEYSITFIIVFAILNGFYSLLMSALDMAKVYFFAQISDKTIGGTYMTLLHTFSNIGYNWPMTLAFYLLQAFTIKDCLIDNESIASLNGTVEVNFYKNETDHNLYTIHNNTCSSNIEKDACLKIGGDCTSSNSFFYLTAVFLALGIFWYLIFKHVSKNLQALPHSAWAKNTEAHKADKDIII